MLDEAVAGSDAGAHLDAGRAALGAGEWEVARAAFQTSVDEAPSAAGFEGLGVASRWLGEQEAAMRALQRAYRLHRRAGDARSAARVALQLCLGECYFHADVAVGLGWVERAERLLEGMEPGVEQAWLTLLRGHLALQVDHDPARARTHAAAARALGHDCGAIDVEMMALGLEGLAYVCEGEVEEGMRRLDEATAAAVAGELDDLDAISSCCCYLIDACKRVRDFERAAQWCEHVKGFCEQWSDRLTFAACRAHYADILIWRGDWSAAEAELRANLGPLADIHPHRIADGMVRLAELRRRQGLFDEASRLLEAADGHFLAPLVRAELALDRGDAAGAAHEAGAGRRRTPGASWRGPCARSATTRRPSARRAPPTRPCVPSVPARRHPKRRRRPPASRHARSRSCGSSRAGTPIRRSPPSACSACAPSSATSRTSTTRSAPPAAPPAPPPPPTRGLPASPEPPRRMGTAGAGIG